MNTTTNNNKQQLTINKLTIKDKSTTEIAPTSVNYATSYTLKRAIIAIPIARKPL